MAAGNRKSTVTRSAWAIQRERLPYLDERPPAPERMKPMADLLQNVCRKAGLTERLWQQSLITDWESLVGKTVAAHTRPGEVQHNTLVIYVDSSPWLSELQRNFARQILATLQERYDSRRIRTLRWRLDPGS